MNFVSSWFDFKLTLGLIWNLSLVRILQNDLFCIGIATEQKQFESNMSFSTQQFINARYKNCVQNDLFDGNLDIFIPKLMVIFSWLKRTSDLWKF